MAKRNHPLQIELTSLTGCLLGGRGLGHGLPEGGRTGIIHAAFNEEVGRSGTFAVIGIVVPVAHYEERSFS